MSSIPDGSFANTAIFAMGFGTGADVDYATLAAMVAKGVGPCGSSQVFHGENAGHDRQVLLQRARRGRSASRTIIDPVIELFAGEHTHLDFYATCAEEAFLITVQGMDFTDANWSFHLEAADHSTAFSDGAGHVHSGAHGMGRAPDVTVQRANGRLTVVVQRDSADYSTWVGRWRLMVAYRARDLSSMTMFQPGELMIPTAAGTVRGPRFSACWERTARSPASARSRPPRAIGSTRGPSARTTAIASRAPSSSRSTPGPSFALSSASSARCSTSPTASS